MKKENEGGINYEGAGESHNMAHSSIMTGSGGGNDGELELSVEMAVPLKPSLRKTSKIPIRLVKVESSIALHSGDLEGKSIGQNGHVVAPPQREHKGEVEAGGSLEHATSQQKMVGSRDSLGDENATHGHVPLTTIRTQGDVSSHPEAEPQALDGGSYGSGYNGGELSGGGSTSGLIPLAPVSSTTHDTTNYPTSNNNYLGDSLSKFTVQPETTSISNINTSLTAINSKTPSHANHSTISDATIANANALAYFTDDMIDIHIVGTKHEHKPGFPLHICAKCDLPIAVYGRLVCFTHDILTQYTTTLGH